MYYSVLQFHPSRTDFVMVLEQNNKHIYSPFDISTFGNEKYSIIKMESFTGHFVSFHKSEKVI